MNSKLGYYKVGNKIFFNKLQAILFANTTLADVEWNFNDDIFSRVNWEESPTLSLSEYYKIRAKQIREENDYIILMCSGGADSTNMVYSFLNNEILVDEIVAGAPLSGLEKWKWSDTDTSENNIISETKYAQLPLMNAISQSHPNIKITIHDYFVDILNMKGDDWIYSSSGHWLHFSGTTRHSLDRYKHIRDLAESGKKIAVVYGIDKPIICRSSSGNLYSTISDAIINIVTPHFKDKYPNVESVYFYYTPDLPDLMVKQAHEVCNWIYRPENSYAKNWMVDQEKGEKFNLNTERGSKWQRGIVPCIYPDVYHDIKTVFQADKQGIGFKGGFALDKWIFQLHGNLPVVDMLKSDFNRFLKSIDKKYVLDSDLTDGFVRFSKLWKIGHESKFIHVNR